jgi:NitT/TauT family transport system substrate-binding protein
LSAVRNAPQSGKIIATTLDYPMVMDTFGCTPAFISANEGAIRNIVKSYYEALEMIQREPARANQIMGADVRQTAEQFAASSAFLRWQGPAENKAFFAGPWQEFSNKAADLLLEIGLIRAKPDIATLVDTRFVQ